MKKNKSYTFTTIFIFYFLIFFFNAPLKAQQWQPNEASKGLLSSDFQVFGVSIIDSNIIWAVATKYEYPSTFVKTLRTTNGGKSWMVFDAPELTNKYCFGIQAFDSLTAWVNTEYNNYGGGSVFKTTDGGKTWNNKLNFGGRYLHFFDKLNGFTRYYANYAYTTDGGESWVNKYVSFAGNEIADASSLSRTNFSVGDTSWFGTSEGRVFRSTDRGKNWKAFSLTLDNAGLEITIISFSDSKNGLAVCANANQVVGNYNGIAKTEDGGETWKFIPLANLPTDFNLSYLPSVAGIPGTNNFLLGYYKGEAVSNYISTDKGVSWTIFNAANWSYGSVEFLNSNTGWMGCTTYRSDYLMYKWNPTKLNTSTNEVQENLNLKLYPNPSDGSFLIDWSVIKDFAPQFLRVIDLTGRVIFENKQLNTLSISQKIDLPTIPNGMYELQLVSDKSVKTCKFVIKK